MASAFVLIWQKDRQVQLPRGASSRNTISLGHCSPRPFVRPTQTSRVSSAMVCCTTSGAAQHTHSPSTLENELPRGTEARVLVSGRSRTGLRYHGDDAVSSIADLDLPNEDTMNWWTRSPLPLTNSINWRPRLPARAACARRPSDSLDGIEEESSGPLALGPPLPSSRSLALSCGTYLVGPRRAVSLAIGSHAVAQHLCVRTDANSVTAVPARNVCLSRRGCGILAL